jgi:hypothetical protein
MDFYIMFCLAASRQSSTRLYASRRQASIVEPPGIHTVLLPFQQRCCGKPSHYLEQLSRWKTCSDQLRLRTNIVDLSPGPWKHVWKVVS